MSATSLLAVQTAGAIAGISGGIGSFQASNQEAALQKQQGNIALQESRTNADLTAYQLTQDVQKQRLGFLASGVSLEGSPALVLAASKSYGQTQVQSILNEGAARYNLAQQEAAMTQNKGRAALIASVAGGMGTEAQGVAQFEKAGGKLPKGLVGG